MKLVESGGFSLAKASQQHREPSISKAGLGLLVSEVAHKTCDAIKRECVASLLLFECQMDNLQLGPGKECVCCQGGQSRVETNVDQDEARCHTDITVRCFLFARFRGFFFAQCLRKFGVGACAALP